MAKEPARTTNLINKDRIDTEFLRSKLKLKSLEIKNNFNKKYPHVEKFFADRGTELANVRQHSAKVITTGALTGTLLFAPPMVAQNISPISQVIKSMSEVGSTSSSIPLQQELLASVNKLLPERVGPMDRSTEKALEQTFSNIIGVPAKATLEGEHLNTTYGYIGAEQHLMRYPGDTMATHPSLAEKDEGMAPGRGAWGYFAYSKSEMTKQDIENEKWYAVVQTLYLPDWKSRLNYLRDWYKYRKVLIVNTENGNAVVADIADSGPAAWTGKHFGGSPEVMNYLGGSRYKKGPVVIFFVDDPQNKVPLGPVEYNNVNIAGVSLKEV